MDQAEFTTLLTAALSNEAVQNKLSMIVKDLKSEVAFLRTIMEKKDERITKLEERVNELENNQDSLEQYTRRNSLRITGMKESENEDPVKVALDLFNNMLPAEDDKVKVEDIDRVHRVGPKAREGSRISTRSNSNTTAETQKQNRDLLVKFATYRVRNRVFRAKKTLNPTYSFDSSNSGPWMERRSVGLPEEEAMNRTRRQAIFINEDLTKARATLLFEARKMKKARKLQDCWTHDGQILVKTIKTNRIVPINCLMDLNKLKP
jgi:hypothetical protein